jgi:predicted Zn finger-like uncharacterized protein
MATITCPNCDGTFRSKKDLTGKKVRCPRCDSSFVVEDDADEIVLPRSAPAAPPRAAPPKGRPSPKPTSKKPSRGKKRKATGSGGGIPKPLLISVGIALLLGAGWYGLQAFNGGGVEIPGLAGGAGGQGGAAGAGGGGGGLASMLGLTDTPESLMQDYTNIGKELQQVLARVSDDASVEPAVKALEGIIWDLVALRRRAALAPQVSKQELYKVLRKYSEDEQSKAADVVKVVEQPPNQVTRHEKIRQALEEMTFLARSTQGAIRQGLEEPPQPRNEFEEIEYERALLLRQAMQQVLQIDDSGGVAAAASAVQETAGKLQALAERKAGMSGASMRGGQAASQYVQWTVRPSALMNEHVQILENKSVAVEPLSSALVALSTADSNVNFAHVPGAFSSASGNTPNAGDPRPSGAVGPMAGAGPAGGRFGPGGGGFGGPPPKTGPVGPGEVVVILKGDVFTELPQDPKEQIVFRQTAFEVLHAAHEMFRQETGIVGSQGRITQGVVTIRGPFDGDPQTLAGKFTFGSVDSVDAAARQIEVTISPSFVEQVRESMQQDR